MKIFTTSGQRTLTRIPSRPNGARDLVNKTTPPAKQKY